MGNLVLPIVIGADINMHARKSRRKYSIKNKKKMWELPRLDTGQPVDLDIAAGVVAPELDELLD